MSSPPRSYAPPPERDGEVQDFSYYGPPPGGYSPDQRVARHQEFRPDAVYSQTRHSYSSSSASQSYQNSREEMNPSFHRPFNPFEQINYPLPPQVQSSSVPVANNDHNSGNVARHHPANDNLRPAYRPWNVHVRQQDSERNNVRRPSPVQHEQQQRNVRSRTASIVTDEEGQNGALNNASPAASNNAPAASNGAPAAASQRSSGHNEKALAHPAASVAQNRSTQVSSTPAHQPQLIIDTLRALEEDTSGRAEAQLTRRALEEPSGDAPSFVVGPHTEEDVSKLFYHEETGDPMAFCCANCRCSPERRNLYGYDLSQGDEGDYFHRHCCHKIKDEEIRSTWLPPLQEIQARIEDSGEELLMEGRHDEEFNVEYPPPPKEIVDNSVVAYSNIRVEGLVKNLDETETTSQLLLSNPKYCENQREFRKEVKRRKNDLKPAVVVEAFGGVGAGLVVLKRLGIAVSKVIHCEHDKIATHVVKHNHDNEYNPNVPDDGIKHIYLSKFEDLANNIDLYVEEHGPIDIIIGGPPCQDYTGINANAQGSSGAQGQFLPMFANFIRAVQAKQPGHPVYFMIENVKLKSSEQELIEEITGVVATIQNALYFSPCVRDRTFWQNIPLENSTHGYKEAAAIKPSSCLEEGWIFPAEEAIECAKVGTFLASKGRINDDATMVKYKKLGDEPDEKQQKFERRHFSALERERMLGFPESYTKSAVEHLFSELEVKAFGVRYPQKDNPETLWKNTLDSKFFCFSGEPVRAEERFDETEKKPFAHIKMSAPQTSETEYFFNAEDYSKHLLGNSFSVPVVEYLLMRLREVFASRDYGERYNYRYRWE